MFDIISGLFLSFLGVYAIYIGFEVDTYYIVSYTIIGTVVYVIGVYVSSKGAAHTKRGYLLIWVVITVLTMVLSPIGGWNNLPEAMMLGLGHTFLCKIVE